MQALKNKKAQIGNLQALVITLVTVGIILGIGFLVLEEFKDNIADTASAGNQSQSWIGVNKTIEAIAKVPQWLGIIVILAIVGILLAILFAVFPRIGAGGTAV